MNGFYEARVLVGRRALDRLSDKDRHLFLTVFSGCSRDSIVSYDRAAWVGRRAHCSQTALRRLVKARLLRKDGLGYYRLTVLGDYALESTRVRW